MDKEDWGNFDNTQAKMRKKSKGSRITKKTSSRPSKRTAKGSKIGKKAEVKEESPTIKEDEIFVTKKVNNSNKDGFFSATVLENSVSEKVLDVVFQNN